MKSIILIIGIFLFTPTIKAQDLFINNKSNRMYEINLDVARKDPPKSVKLLIDNLSIINTNYISRMDKNNEKPIMNTIIYLITLRTLTVTGFTAKTSYTFNDKSEIEKTRKYFLYLYSTNSIPFYSQWMSRNSYFIAPVDAQKAIIKKWKEWYRKNANTWQYNTNQIIKDVHSPYPKIEDI